MKKLLIVGNPNSMETLKCRRVFKEYDITVCDVDNEEAVEAIRNMDFDALIVNEVDKIQHLLGE